MGEVAVSLTKGIGQGSVARPQHSPLAGDENPTYMCSPVSLWLFLRNVSGLADFPLVVSCNPCSM